MPKLISAKPHSCIRLLLLFLISTTYAASAAFNINRCTELTADSKCQCSPDEFKEIVIKCPAGINFYADDAGVVIVAKIQCNEMNKNDIKIPVSLDTGNVSEVEIEKCDFTGVSIQNFLEKLGIRNVKTLRISESSFGVEFSNQHQTNELSSLEELWISHSGSTQMPAEFSVNFPNLKKLHVTETSLHIQQNIFENLEKLERLHLQGNNLEQLPKGIFRKQLNLIELDLSKNNLHKLSKTVFEGAVATSLQKLDLSWNGIESLPPHVFSLLKNLTEIKLSSNELHTLPANIFALQTNLEQLDLSDNKLQSLPDELFRNTRSLKTLKLSHNHLTEISAQIFAPLVKLEELYVDNNQLITIDPTAFYKTKNLLYINMENNRIKLSDPITKNRKYVETASPFRFLLKLQTLILRNNSIADWNRGHMPVIKLRTNGDLVFERKNAAFFDLSHNHIETIDFLETSPKISFNLNHNPLVCDCKIKAFVRYIKSFNSNFIINDLVCAKPNLMENQTVLDIQLEYLPCPIEQSHCPMGCSCWERNYHKVLMVDCSGVNLTEVPVLPSTMKTFLNKTIELHFERNNLRYLSGIEMITEYANVTKIYAAYNKLSEIDVDKLPTTLSYLDLSHNNFKRLSDHALNFFTRDHSKIELILAENPWDCDCTLMRFVQQNFAMITDYRSIYCAGIKAQNMLDYAYSNENCRDKPGILMNSLLCILCAGTLIAAAAAFYYKFENDVNVWMYKYRWLRSWLIRNERQEKQRRYDAFISYSRKNAEFVEEVLVPKLENLGPIPFKLCLHLRDLILGGCTPDQITRTMDDSRRIIFVLSRHFIEFDWARMEFRTALKAALNEPQTRLILILYDDIGEVSSLDYVLEGYLKTNTSLKWGDRRFWDRLRYAMPHTSNEITEVEEAV